jgi:group I intron endonuclease
MEIYVITNKINGKKYVGKTALSIERRWRQHVTNAKCGRTFRLYHAMRKWGTAAFTIDSVARASSDEELDMLEHEWIARLKSFEYTHGYNMTTGGEGWTGRRHTNDTRRKIGDKATGRPKTENFRRRISETHKGKPKSLEQRRKMASHWDEARREEQAEVARRVNATKGSALYDFTCDLCGKSFMQVKSGVLGGHRKACKRIHGVPPKNSEPLFED